MDPRTVKPQIPPRLIVGAVLAGVLLLAFIFFAIWYSGRGIQAAKMTGVVVGKEFVPAAERQISLSREGAVRARDKEGDYIVTIEVPQPDGTKKPYTVWLGKEYYDSIKVGDAFDVGPYLVP